MSTSPHGCIHQQLSNARKLCQIYSAFGPITIRLKHRPTPLRTTRNIWISCSDHMLKCRWLNRGWRQRLAPGCCHCSLFRVPAQSFDCCSARLSASAALQFSAVQCSNVSDCSTAVKQCKHFCTRGQLWLGPWPNLGSATPWQNMELLLFKISKIFSTANTISIALQLEYCRISVSREPVFQNFPSHHFPRTMTCAEYK